MILRINVIGCSLMILYKLVDMTTLVIIISLHATLRTVFLLPIGIIEAIVFDSREMHNMHTYTCETFKLRKIAGWWAE